MRTFYFISSLVFVLILLGACSPKIGSKIKSSEFRFYPEELDTAHIQYLTNFNSNIDLVGKQSAFKTSIVGEQDYMGIAKPYGVEISNGKIYVCDVTFRGLDILDLEKKSFTIYHPKERGKSFNLPLTVAADNGTIYIADPYKGVVHAVDSNLIYIAEIGKNELVGPTGVAVDEGKIYVVDSKDNKVKVFEKDSWDLIDYFPKNAVVGNEDWLYTPTNIAITKERIYITDMGATCVKAYSLNGEYIMSIGQLGAQGGSFVRPKGLAVDREENIYVVDGAFENIQIFNKEGQLLLFFGESYKREGDLWLPTDVTIDYDNLEYFQKYVDPRYELEYVILVANQYGPEKITVYGKIKIK